MNISKVSGVVGATLGCFVALVVLNLFIYGFDLNLGAAVLFGGGFGLAVGIVLALKPARIDTFKWDLGLGTAAMTAVWLLFCAVIYTLNGDMASSVDYVLGTLAMAVIGLWTGFCYNFTRILSW
jgi:hypothetical protein